MGKGYILSQISKDFSALASRLKLYHNKHMSLKEYKHSEEVKARRKEQYKFTTLEPVKMKKYFHLTFKI